MYIMHVSSIIFKLQTLRFIRLNFKIIIFDFRLNNKQDIQKYGQIVLDFSYFNNSSEIEKKIDINPVRNIN